MSNPRRFFLKQLGLLGVASGLQPQVFAQQPDLAAGFSFTVPPYLQNLQDNQVSIYALVNKKAFCWLELLADNGQCTQHYEVLEGLRQANKKIARIRLENLTANTTYRYRIHAKEILKFDPYAVVYGAEIVSAEAEFRTLADQQDRVSCVILNDIHENTSSYATLLSLLPLDRQDFVVNNGDAVDYLGNADDLEIKMLAPLSALLKGRIPFIMNRGNHETRGAYAFDYNQYLDYPEKHNYHAFLRGNTYWVFLDTGEDKPDDAEVYAGLSAYDPYREEQALWFSELAKTKAFKKAKFKVVIMHIPPYASGDWHGTMHVRKLFSPLFDQHGVDLVISGHTHKHGYHPADAEHAYPILIGAGPKIGERTIITVQGEASSLQFSLIREDGEVLFSKELKK